MLPKEESQRITQEMDVAWKEHEKFIESLEKEAIAYAERKRMEKREALREAFLKRFPFLGWFIGRQKRRNVMIERSKTVTFPNGVKLVKWGRTEEPTAESVAEEMRQFEYTAYDLQTVAPWFERSRHAHDEPEIRGAVSGVITFHFDDFPVTIEAGDILLIPGGMQHEVISHNGRPFSAYKGSLSGERKVTEYA